MTVARFNARGRTRLLLFFGVILSGLIFVIVFHNNQQENDELRQLELRCQQQLGAIQAQKSRVDKSLDTEKLQLDEARTKQAELIEKLKVSDQKYASLQQECKFSQTNHEDRQKECEKTRLKQVTEIDELKQKIKELKQKFDDTMKEKEKEISSLKFQLEKHENVADVDENMVTQLKQRNTKLEEVINRLKTNCDKTGLESSSTANAVKSKPFSVKNFSEQISISPNVYLVVSNSTARSNLLNTNSKSQYSSSLTIPVNQKIKNNNKFQVKTTQDNGIITSVENFQIAQQPILSNDAQETYKNKEDEGNVLAQPQILNKRSTTTTTESPKGIRSSSQKSVGSNGDSNKLVAPPILQAPTVIESKSSTPVKKERVLPEGVVPPPESSWLNKDNTQQENARYSNAIDDGVGIAGQEGDAKNNDNLNFLIGNEQENLAHEMADNDFNIDEKKVNPENPGGIGEEKIDNNAEEDTNVYDPNKDVFNSNKDLLHGNRRSGGNADTKLRNEVAGDHGKEGDHYPDEDLRIEGQNEEEGDMGDYDDPNVMKQGPAERNK